MKILITGNNGYVGTVLTEKLIESGYNVTGYDINYFENCLIDNASSNFNQVVKDIRDIEKKDLEGFESIIHLAGLSNDPLGEFNPSLTKEINFDSTIKLASLAKKSGINRFIYASSQSMYGISDSDSELDEYSSEKKPVTAYAKTKWDAEVELNRMQTDNFAVCSFRPSTVFGFSPRLRCDIVYNNLVACAYTTGKIEILSDGSPWRPVVHVKDVCQAFIAGLEAPTDLINGKSYNVGVPNGNFTVKDLALAAQKSVPGSDLIFLNKHSDPRTYKVSFKRILNELKEWYKPEYDLMKGGKELVSFFKKINFKKEDFRGRNCNRLKQLKFLIKSKQISSSLRSL